MRCERCTRGAISPRAIPSMRAVGYRQLWAHLEGECGLAEAVERAHCRHAPARQAPAHLDARRDGAALARSGRRRAVVESRRASRVVTSLVFDSGPHVKIAAVGRFPSARHIPCWTFPGKLACCSSLLRTIRSRENKENPMAKGQSLQDPFLNALRKERVPVSIYLVNGIKLQGQIDSFDQFVVLLKNSVSQMVYKHAISTVVPARNVRLTAEEGAVAGGVPRRVMLAARRCRVFERPRSGERARAGAPRSRRPGRSGGSRGVHAACGLGRRAARRHGDRPPRAARSAFLRRQRQGGGAASRRPRQATRT